MFAPPAGFEFAVGNLFSSRIRRHHLSMLFGRAGGNTHHPPPSLRSRNTRSRRESTPRAGFRSKSSREAQGAVIWVYIAEVFPSRVRAKGQSLGSSSHWIMNAIIAGAFPYIAAKSEAAPFAFFAAMMLVQFVVVLFIYPETKGISLEAIQARLKLT